MKYTILIFALFTITLNTKAQVKIEYQYNEYKGDTIKRTTWIELNKPKNWKSTGARAHIRFSNTQGFIFLELKAETYGAICVVMPDASFDIVLEDGTVLNLHNYEFAMSEQAKASVNNRRWTETGLHLYFHLEPEELATLCRSPIKKARLFTDSGWLEIIPEKREYKLNAMNGAIAFYGAASFEQ